MSNKVTKLAPKGAVPQSLSAAVLTAFYFGPEQARTESGIAKVEVSRLKYLFGFFPTSDTSAVREACKGLQEAGEKMSDKGKASAQYASAKARAAEVKALYGANHFHGFNPEGLSYHAAVATARNILKDTGTRWSGDRMPEPWEKEVRAEIERNAQVQLATRMEIERENRKHPDQPLSETEVQAIETRSKVQAERADMIALAGGLVRKYGTEKTGWLIEALEAKIAQTEQEAAIAVKNLPSAQAA